MNAAEVIHHYGYGAIAVGTFFEGEFIMLAAGIAACAGVLSLPLVIAAGMGGTFASDTVCFLLGRLAGERLQRWFPGLHLRLGRIFRLMERHDEKLLLGYQFVPGLCTVTPIAYGMSRISVLRFLALDLVGNACWTLAFAVGGYAFGEAFARVVRNAPPWAPLLVGLILVGGLGVLGVSRSRSARPRPLNAD